MPERETKFYAQAGYQSGRGGEAAFLNVTQHTPVGEALDTKRKEFHYELRFNDDNNEVQLVKHGNDPNASGYEASEIVYSEILDESLRVTDEAIEPKEF